MLQLVVSQACSRYALPATCSYLQALQKGMPCSGSRRGHHPSHSCCAAVQAAFGLAVGFLKTIGLRCVHSLPVRILTHS